MLRREQTKRLHRVVSGLSNQTVRAVLSPFVIVLLAVLYLAVDPPVALAENLVFRDVFPVAGDGVVSPRCTVLDPAGNIYHAGGYGAAADFDPGPGVVNVPHVLLSDIYVSKLDASGALLWAWGVGGIREESAQAIAVDATGNTYVAGIFNGTVDFDPGPGVLAFTSSIISNETFILKLDPDGVLQWAGHIKAQGLDAVKAIAVDDTGNVYFAGQFSATVDFDPGAGTANLTASGASADAYICKLDSSGNHVWARALGGNLNELIYDLAIDSSGNVLSTGYKFGSPDFDPGPGTTILPAAGDRDTFVHKMDASGNFLWAGQLAGAGLEQGQGIAVDSTGNVYVTGQFRDAVDFDPGPGTFILPASGVDSYVCKLDSSGAFLWAGSTAPGVDQDYGRAIAVDGAGGVYVTGQFRGVLDFDPGPGTYSVYSMGGTAFNTYVWRLDTNGAIEWAGVYLSSTGMLPFEILVDGAGAVYSLFMRGSDVDLDPGDHEFIVSNGGLQPYLIAKLEPQQLPVANADSGEVDADTVLSVLTGPTANSILDNDSDGNPRSMLAVTAFDAISALGADVSITSDGMFTYDPTAAPVLQLLLTGDSTVDTFSYTVSDGTDATVGTVSILVHGKGSGAHLPAMRWWGLTALLAVMLFAGASKLRVRALRTD